MNEAIAWLRSPEGERWSHAFVNPNGGGPSRLQPTRDTYPGFFSIKGDEENSPVGSGYSGSMRWGEMPGDDKLYKEYIDSMPWGDDKLYKEYLYAGIDAGIDLS